MDPLQLAADVIVVCLVTDVVSGVFHRWQDAYGDPFWPVVGTHVTRPNILHHYAPRALLAKSWFVSSRALLAIGLALAAAAWMTGTPSWQVALGLTLGVNMNQVHKWSHGGRRENPMAVRALQHIGLLQSPAHHRRHHAGARNSHYCIFTNAVNPVLDRLRVWPGLEWLIARGFGIRRRGDTQRAAMVLAREPEFFGEYLPLVRRRVAAELAREARTGRTAPAQ